jgi:hypothetical protein
LELALLKVTAKVWASRALSAWEWPPEVVLMRARATAKPRVRVMLKVLGCVFGLGQPTT